MTNPETTIQEVDETGKFTMNGQQWTIKNNLKFITLTLNIVTEDSGCYDEEFDEKEELVILEDFKKLHKLFNGVELQELIEFEDGLNFGWAFPIKYEDESWLEVSQKVNQLKGLITDISYGIINSYNISKLRSDLFNYFIIRSYGEICDPGPGAIWKKPPILLVTNKIFKINEKLCLWNNYYKSEWRKDYIKYLKEEYDKLDDEVGLTKFNALYR